MIHEACNIQNYQEDEELMQIWIYVEGLSEVNNNFKNWKNQ